MTATPARIRVLVCEDSRTYAAALKRLLEHDGTIEVVAVCTTAEEAIETIAAGAPDLVTMDVELPGMSGLDAVERIMATRPLPIVVISSHVGADATLTAAALAAGALDAVSKDDLDLTNPGGAAAAAFRHRAHVLSRARVIRHLRGRLRAASPPTRVQRRATAIGICASTGGPQALATILRSLPESYAVPVLVVQHMSPGFTEGLARWLDGVVPPTVQLARTGATADRGVWIAPDGAHLVLRPDLTLALDRTSPAGLHRPSGDALLTSLAAAAGAAAVAVVLTGMGRDGAVGAQAVRDAGGLVLAQDEESSAVFGMPKAAAESGATTLLPPEELGSMLAGLVHVDGGRGA